jgi:hypothetical protein
MSGNISGKVPAVPVSRRGVRSHVLASPPRNARETAGNRSGKLFPHVRDLSCEAERQAVRGYATEAVQAFVAGGVQPWEVLFAMRVARPVGAIAPATWTDVQAAVASVSGEDWAAATM